jgi:cytochrome P450
MAGLLHSGPETTSTTLTWSVLHIASYPDIQQRVQVGSRRDLFIAGSEMTSTTLSWSVLYMARHPDIQHRVQVG